jgi:hypothetical protein
LAIEPLPFDGLQGKIIHPSYGAVNRKKILYMDNIAGFTPRKSANCAQPNDLAVEKWPFSVDKF